MSDDLKFGYYDCTDNKNLTAPYCQFCGKQHYPTMGGCTQNSFTPPTIPNGCGGDCAPIKRVRESEIELRKYKMALGLMANQWEDNHRCVDCPNTRNCENDIDGDCAKNIKSYYLKLATNNHKGGNHE